MDKILKFSVNKGRERGILSLYILNSLFSSPKSGYEIINEIKDKTKGKWIPSKGSVYPLLNHLKEEGLISIKSIDKRAKKNFKLTGKGKRLLLKIKKDDFEDKIFVFKEIILEIFGKRNSVNELVFELVEEVKHKKRSEKKVEKLLKKTLSELKRIK